MLIVLILIFVCRYLAFFVKFNSSPEAVSLVQNFFRGEEDNCQVLQGGGIKV